MRTTVSVQLVPKEVQPSAQVRVERDAVGNPLSIDRHAISSETTPQGVVNYTYDAAGRRLTMTVCGQPTITYGYDHANKLTNITQGGAVVAFTYDAAGRRTSTHYPNGVLAAYGYDAANRVTSITFTNGGTTLGGLSYGYDSIGNRTLAGGRLASILLPTTMSSSTYDAANRLTQWASTSLTYDLGGNLTSDGTNTYTWNSRNQLVAISGSTTASFAYDAFGRRISRTVNGAVKRYLYDGLNTVQELDATSPTANLLTGLRIDETFLRSDSSGTYGLLADVLGSTVALANSSGVITTSYAYDGFGQVQVSGAASSNRQQFTGRENDGTGLLYFRARYYSPTLQRFISDDPMGLASGLNASTYGDNNPLRYVDPLGLYASNPTDGESGNEEPGGTNDSVSRSLEAAIRNGDPAEIPNIVDAASEVLGPEARKQALSYAQRLESKAVDVIAREMKGSIKEVFPNEMMNKTLEDIFRLARGGNRAAQTAKKLLTQSRFMK